MPVINAYSKDLGDNDGRGAGQRRAHRRGRRLADRGLRPVPVQRARRLRPERRPAGYALETQTRPFYSPRQFANGSNVSVVVHELAHQWYGDSVSVDGWKDIWINEGFARYAQWLWSEKEGEGTAQELADYVVRLAPGRRPVLEGQAGRPGPGEPVPRRGLRPGRDGAPGAAQRDRRRGLLRRSSRAGRRSTRYGNATVGDFVQYAEKVSGKPLAALFDTWLYQPSKPACPGGAGRPRSRRLAGTAPAQPKSWKKIAATDRSTSTRRSRIRGGTSARQ